MSNWSLTALYKGYGEEFLNDYKKAQALVNSFQETSENLAANSNLETLVNYLKDKNQLIIQLHKLISFVHLNLATNTSDPTSNNYAGQLAKLTSLLAKPEALFSNYLASVEAELPQWIEDNPYLKEHHFVLNETLLKHQYQLNEEVEAVISLMEINASKAWSNLQDLLTSKSEIMLNGEKKTLPEIRNLAYDFDQAVRKDAYHKELKLYEDIKDATSFALNSIKGEVVEISKIRGYQSVLEKTLIDSRLSKASLDAMFLAIDEYLPIFRNYLKHKASLLGHSKGLPWYDLFAPIGKGDQKTYSVAEAKEYIINTFSSFDQELADLAKTAFEDDWVDFLPKKGKVGGAFCANLQPIKQSRILTNFGGSISDIVTLAHELGHAYHGYQIEDFLPLNTDYTMPVAETASTFSENIVLQAALKDSNDEEKIQLIENSLQDLTQIVVDIYSRYLFESAVIEKRTDSFMFADELNQIMLDAQKQTYGDGLDNDYLHPYMWLCKSHYYSVHNNFYNFPYAFGGLFALGLFAIYLKEGAAFVPKYNDILKATTTNSCEAVALMADIDITDPKFWKGSLDIIANRIEQFITLTKKGI